MPPGGAETQILLLSRALASSGLRVGLVVYQTAHHLPRAIDGVRIITRPAYVAHSPLIGKIREAIRIWSTLYRADARTIVKRSYGVDVGIVAVYARLAGARFVYSSANVVDFSAEQLLLKRRDLRMFHLGLRLADQIVVQTEEQVDLCKGRFGRDPVLIKSIAEDLEPANLVAGKFLWISRIIGYKQPLAFLELAERLPDAQFAMVAVPNPGSAESMALHADVEAKAEKLDNFELLPPRPRSELGPLIDRAVAVVNTADYEGMPNVLLEGWARGIPALVLSHDPGEVVETYRLGKYAGGSMERFTSQAQQLWETRNDSGDLRRRCLEYVRKNHSEAEVAQRWDALLGALAAGEY